MTEYDYSPDAIERHLAKQAGIANWVDATNDHEPTNPFMPLPGEHAPSETFYHTQPHHPAPQYPYSYQQPQPAFYATPQGVISPTYTSSKKRHHKRHHHNGSHHTSGSKSLRPSPHSATSALPMATGLSYAPTPQRSVSTPPSMPVGSMQGMMVPVAMASSNTYFGYPAQQQQLYQPFTSPPLMQQAQGYPYPYVTSPPAMTSPPQPPMMAPTYSYSSSRSHHSHSRPSSSRRSSHSYSQSQTHMVSSSPMQASPYGQMYQSSSNQPLVVPINGGSGGYVVVPAGQSVQVLTQPANYASYSSSDYELVQRPTDYESESDSDHSAHAPSFLGSLSFKKLGTTLKSRKSRR